MCPIRCDIDRAPAKRLPSRAYPLLCVFLIAAQQALLAPAIQAGQPGRDADVGARSAVKPDESWNAVFDRTDGWTGADVAGTVDLGDGRVLWLFGDTWVGSIREKKRVAGAWMVNNSIAVHAVDKAAPWKPPDPAAVRFYWGANDAQGKPTAWAVLPERKSKSLTPANSRQWLWATGGGLSVPGPANSRRLAIFFFRVETNPQGKGVWNFSVVGTTLGIVDNVLEPADRWKVRLLDVPHAIASKSRPAGGPAEAEITWGMAACLDPASARAKKPDLLIFGVRKTSPFNTSLVLARAPAAIEQFDLWTFYSGKELWSPRAADAAPIADGLASECSVEPISRKGQTLWVLIQSEPFLGRRIFVRTASRPIGPWSPRKTVYTVTDVDRNRSYFTYAAKGHGLLSRPGELLVTYLVNSNQFGDLIRDTSIYRPKFIRIPEKEFFFAD